MSRSYRRNGFIKQNSSKVWKRFANKRVRRCKDVPNGMGYRKVFNSWSICDQGACQFDADSWWLRDEPWKVFNK